MAEYTIELGDIVKTGYNIFDFDYVFYDDEKKPDFEQNFINHFYFREIGCETVTRFKHYLKCKFNELLPYYNEIFKTALIEYQKTVNYSLTETFELTRDKTDDITANTDITANNQNNATETNTNTSNHEITSQGKNYGTHTDVNTHELSNTLTKSNDSNDTNTNTKNVTDSVNNQRIESNTPQGSINLTDVKGGVYASKVDIDNNSNTLKDTNDFVGNKHEDGSEVTQQTNTDNLSNEYDENSTGYTTDKNTSTTTNALTNNMDSTNNTKTAQNIKGKEIETSTKTLQGSYGVITEADMLQKHLKLQEILTSAMINFFNDCEDLFMGIF